MNLDDFLTKELTSMSENICNNYRENMENRTKNPFLCFEDDSIKKYMALGRSFDSQLGNRIQRIIFFLARKKYGDIMVPNIVSLDLNERSREMHMTLYAAPIDLAKEKQNKDFDPFAQYIYIGKKTDRAKIKSKLKIKARSDGLLTKEYVLKSCSDEVIKSYNKMKGKQYPVDLLTLSASENDNSGKIDLELYVYEIKMGGNLDTKNAPSNADEVSKNKIIFSFIKNSHSCFATCYGSCSPAVKNAIKKKKGELLSPEMLWKRVIPSEISYEDFIEKFKKAFKSSSIEKVLQNL